MDHELHILRHAKSASPAEAESDFHRLLKPRGERDATRIGRHMVENGWRPDTVIASPAARARHTVELVLAAFDGVPPSIVWKEQMYLAELSDLLAIIRGADESARRMLIVGHNPGLTVLAQCLGDVGDAGDRLVLATGTLIRLGVDTTWADIKTARHRVLDIVHPKGLA